MLHVIFMILKMLGIILLVIMAVAICLVGCILFIPIRYKVQGSYYDGFTGTAKIMWFLHVLSVKASYDGEPNLCLRILGIPFYNSKHRKAKKKKEPSSVTTDENIESSELKTEEKATLQREPTKIAESAKSIKSSADQSESYKYRNESLECEVSSENENEEKKGSLYHKIKDLWDTLKVFVYKLKQFFQNIKYTIKTICDKIKQTHQEFEYYRDILQSDEMKTAFSLCKKQLYHIWKTIRPRKFHVYLHIGTEDPCVTGEIMAFYGMIYPFAGKYIEVVPEFQETILEAECKAVGHITVFVLLKVFIIVYFDKNIRYLLQLLKKEDSHGR